MFDNEVFATAIARFLNSLFGEMDAGRFWILVQMVRATLFVFSAAVLTGTIQAWTAYRLGTQTKRID